MPRPSPSQSSTRPVSETVAIHHPGDPTRPTVIRADRFDPRRHRRWGEPQEVIQHEGSDASPEAGPIGPALADREAPDPVEGLSDDESLESA